MHRLLTTSRELDSRTPSLTKEAARHLKVLRPRNGEKIELFDIFADEKTLGEGKESAAYRFTFRAADRTLTDDEVNKAYNKLRDRLAADLKVELR